MERLIDANELYVDARIGENEEPYISLYQINNAPTVDAEPVKHGHWINDKGLYKCSVCNELWCHWWANTVPIERMNKMMRYCPLCGAKMTLD